MAGQGREEEERGASRFPGMAGGIGTLILGWEFGILIFYVLRRSVFTSPRVPKTAAWITVNHR
jgi:hypothetical protein